MIKKSFIFAGEASGDLHGSALMRAFSPNVHFFGVGGREMQRVGLEASLSIERFQMMGFTAVIPCLPRLWKDFRFLIDLVLKRHPDCVILIDFPGFNLRFASSLRKRGYSGKIVHYISPSVWAHGKARIQNMVRSLDLLLTIYPFEKEYFQGTGLNVEYVGHPLIERMEKKPGDACVPIFDRLPHSNSLITLFPGSREKEIARHTKIQLKTALLIRKQIPESSFAISCAHPSFKPYFEAVIKETALVLDQDIYIVESRWNEALMQHSRLALAKSGTITLELALRKCPSLILYSPSFFDYLIAKYWLRLNLPFYCIVNILGGRMIFPEFIQRELDPKELALTACQLYTEGELRERALTGCQEVASLLGPHLASQQAADAIMRLYSS